jgi:hypothetical protein
VPQRHIHGAMKRSLVGRHFHRAQSIDGQTSMPNQSWQPPASHRPRTYDAREKFSDSNKNQSLLMKTKLIFAAFVFAFD